MKRSLTTLILILLSGGIAQTQPIPADSLYLGQTPPGTTPVVFALGVQSGSFDAERIAISGDGKEIYYTGIQDYYPTTGDTIRYYRYQSNHWTGPFNLFGSYLAPALSENSDTLFYQHNGTTAETYFSAKTGNTWSAPQRMLASLNSAHYYQVTDNGNRYISSVSTPTMGLSDWCKLAVNGSDTMAVSLGLPVNSNGDNLDFFVSRDEDFMIIARGELKISYHKPDGNWTNPKSLGDQINFGLGMWGPFVTTDDKYLFYTTGTQPNYSDVHVYWVRVDGLIDSLRYTNFIPYVKNKISDQTAIINEPFNFTIPDTTFVDDDGNSTLVYHATLINGSALPAWLDFDTVTGTFTGTPTEIETLPIRVTAIDTAGASVGTPFKIVVTAHASNGKNPDKTYGIAIWPNPGRGIFRVSCHPEPHYPTAIEIVNLNGQTVCSNPYARESMVDLTGQPKGIYFVRLISRAGVSTEKIILL